MHRTNFCDDKCLSDYDSVLTPHFEPKFKEEDTERYVIILRSGEILEYLRHCLDSNPYDVFVICHLEMLLNLCRRYTNQLREGNSGNGRQSVQVFLRKRIRVLHILYSA